jgi:hypothetical protein
LQKVLRDEDFGEALVSFPCAHAADLCEVSNLLPRSPALLRVAGRGGAFTPLGQCVGLTWRLAVCIDRESVSAC